MFKIKMYTPVIKKTIDMPKDNDLELGEAIYRAELYSKRYSAARFFVIDESNNFDVIVVFENGETV
jgi:hypothetical protein